MRRNVYEEAGELDTTYGIGMFEDDDYCMRVRQLGYKLAIVEDAFVFHHGSVSFKKLEDKKYRALFEKNKLLYEQKWNQNWKMPNPPASIFFDAMDSDTVKERLISVTRPKLLLLGNPSSSARIEEIINELASIKDSLFIVANLISYLGNDIVGTRKAGPNLYLTNRIDLFESATFDAILYCGDFINTNKFRSKLIMIDKSISHQLDDQGQHAVIIENAGQILEQFNQTLQLKTV
jgi:hypothetical protein